MPNPVLIIVIYFSSTSIMKYAIFLSLLCINKPDRIDPITPDRTKEIMNKVYVFKTVEKILKSLNSFFVSII